MPAITSADLRPERRTIGAASEAAKPGGPAQGKAGGGGAGKAGGGRPRPGGGPVGPPMGGTVPLGPPTQGPPIGVNQLYGGGQMTPPMPVFGSNIPTYRPAPNAGAPAPPGMVRPQQIANQGIDIPFDPRTLR